MRSAFAFLFMTLIRILIVIVIIMAIYPLIWLGLNTFKSNEEIFSGSQLGFPAKWSLDGFRRVLIQDNFMQYFGNSLIVSAGAILLTTILSIMLAYAIARMDWRLKTASLKLLYLAILIPAIIEIVPVFILVKMLGLVNHLLALVLTSSAFSISMATVIVVGFLKGIPREMEEAAVMDGCGLPRILAQIIFPLIKAPLSTVFIIVFLGSWNDLLYPLVLISDKQKATIPLALLNYAGQYGINYNAIFTALFITSIIPVVLFLTFSSQVERALTAGSLLK
jgi:raffinose/stachyose/melibiose transport system permease protein